MASNTKQTSLIRKKKDRPNKANLKAFQKRITQNALLLRELEAQEKTRQG